MVRSIETWNICALNDPEYRLPNDEKHLKIIMELSSESIFYKFKTNQLNIGKGSEKTFFS